MEILLGFLVLGLAIVPMIGLFTTGRESAHMSEHQIYAELVSARFAEELTSRPFGYLVNRELGGGSAAKVWTDCGPLFCEQTKETAFVADLEEYRQNAWRGAVPIKTSARLVPVADPAVAGEQPGGGLVAVTVSATWGDTTEGRTKLSSYHVVRLKAKEDYGARRIDGSKL